VGSVEQYLKPDVISQIGRLDFQARFIVEGFFAGLHRSPFHGFSVEFSDHRKYTWGDELKSIDWNVYGRTDKYYVKRFEAETNMTCYLVLDVSNSMDYASKRVLSKLQYAIYLAAALSYMMLRQQDAVSLFTFDKRIRTFIPPKSKRTQLGTVLGELAGIEATSESQLAHCLHEVAFTVKKRSLMLIMSDLMAEPDPVYEALHHLRHDGHEVIIFHILDPSELRFPFSGNTVFKDSETAQTIKLDPKSIRKEYLSELDRFIKGYHEMCELARIDYVQMDTSVGFDKALMSFLMARIERGL